MSNRPAAGSVAHLFLDLDLIFVTNYIVAMGNTFNQRYIHTLEFFLASNEVRSADFSEAAAVNW